MTKLSIVLIGTGGGNFVHRQLAFFLFKNNEIYRQLAIGLTLLFFQALFCENF